MSELRFHVFTLLEKVSLFGNRHKVTNWDTLGETSINKEPRKFFNYQEKNLFNRKWANNQRKASALLVIAKKNTQIGA